MRLDAGSFRYMTKEDVRILTSVEMGQKNHEYVPEQLIESIAHLRRCGVFGRLQVLIKHGLLHHEGGKADGYKLTYNGYDCLALRALTNRGVIDHIGTRIGVGKESDIHMCTDANGTPLVVKFHRLGRISFRTVKSNRDYLENRSHASWMYMARLAARKEFQYMKALYEAGFPVPKPVDNNRHAVLMEYMKGSIPLYQVPPNLEVNQVETLLDQIFKLLMRFAICGLVHGDFNEFNLLIDLSNIKKLTVIDFPQIISMDHSEAQNQFERDVQCICRFFEKRFRYTVDSPPEFGEVYEMYRKNLDSSASRVITGEIEGENELDQYFKESCQIETEEEGDDEGDDEGGDEEEEEQEQEGEDEASENEESDDSEVSQDESSEASGTERSPRRRRKDDRVIQDPRHLLRAKKKQERKEAAPKIAPVPKLGRSHAKPNKSKKSSKSNAVREVKAWKAEGGW